MSKVPIQQQLKEKWTKEMNFKYLEAEKELKDLIYKLANQYAKNPSQVEDLAQEGRYGLMVSIMKYDSSFKCKLITYAYFWVRKYIAASARSMNNFISIPETLETKAKRVVYSDQDDPKLTVRAAKQILNLAQCNIVDPVKLARHK